MMDWVNYELKCDHPSCPARRIVTVGIQPKNKRKQQQDFKFCMHHYNEIESGLPTNAVLLAVEDIEGQQVTVNLGASTSGEPGTLVPA